VPIVVSGERITAEAIELFRRYGIEKIDVVK
jgi:arginine/lysine/ornithine decarboxylase